MPNPPTQEWTLKATMTAEGYMAEVLLDLDKGMTPPRSPTTRGRQNLWSSSFSLEIKQQNLSGLFFFCCF